ncbi:hypothetical protein COCMIDRAFT_22321 [Bipolaris oryzae ATCC 44560]|uniref:Uncharacterized protein n=1 Tax=Bipolaris oryzae ATCC 44560 TaxID=930090 RepID=W6ZEI5_COCMI|nr:uncharacterized protein COCMIDRAFT_22321 [Bipolaris oryzae ATCC 44560]EUC50227.1 hypothetical protein COCMIDRAFT_22321 [Bipolaris oryzae ATCC 44560]
MAWRSLDPITTTPAMARSAQLESNLDAPLPRPVLHVYTAHPRLGTSSGPACTTNRQSAALALGPSADPRLQKAHPTTLAIKLAVLDTWQMQPNRTMRLRLVPPRTHLDLPLILTPAPLTLTWPWTWTWTWTPACRCRQVNPRTGERHATIGPPTPKSRQICPSYLRFALIQVPAQERVEWENCCKNLV